MAASTPRSSVAFCGDGGLSMLLGDLLTAVHHDLHVKLIVFNNGRLGMVKLEQEQAGLPEFGTKLGDFNFAAIATTAGMHAERVTESDALEGARQRARPPWPRAPRCGDQP
jgi:pyruvate dehydrogenase (quinone)